jgi:hypothetical protein
LIASEKFDVDPQMFQGMDGGGSGGADEVGHIKAGKATISLGQPNGRTCYTRIYGTEGLGNIHFFLLEKRELSEQKFPVFSFASDALAWGVLNVRNFFQSEILCVGGFDDGFGQRMEAGGGEGGAEGKS